MCSFTAFTSRRCRGNADNLRRSYAYTCGVVHFTLAGLMPLPHESLHQLGESEEVMHPQKRAPAAHDDLRIRPGDVGPLPRHRANVIVVDAQQQPGPVAVVALPDAGKLLPRQRMERMRDAHKTRDRARRACILHRGTSDSRRARSACPGEPGQVACIVEAAELLLVLEGIDLSSAVRRPRWAPQKRVA